MIIITIVVASSKTRRPFAYHPQIRGHSRFARHGIGSLVNLCMMLYILQGAIA